MGLARNKSFVPVFYWGMLHIIYIPFTGVGIPGYRGDQWFAQRIEIFKNHTLQSLKAQTNKNFVVWVSFRAEEESNDLVDEIALALVKAGIRFVFTFHGLMYYDDKYTPDINGKLKNFGRIIRSCYRSGRWRDIRSGARELLRDKNATLLKRLTRSLHTLQKSRVIDPQEVTETVLMTRLDSDDLLHKNAVEEIQQAAKQFPTFGAYTIQEGYIYNAPTGELAEYNPQTNPPFHTIAFRNYTFFSPLKHFNTYKTFRSHEDIPEIFNTLAALNRGFCVTTHNPKNHISTTFNHPFRGKLIDNEKEKRAILKTFGIG